MVDDGHGFSKGSALGLLNPKVSLRLLHRSNLPRRHVSFEFTPARGLQIESSTVAQI